MRGYPESAAPRAQRRYCVLSDAPNKLTFPRRGLRFLWADDMSSDRTRRHTAAGWQLTPVFATRGTLTGCCRSRSLPRSFLSVSGREPDRFAGLAPSDRPAAPTSSHYETTRPDRRRPE
jgi:hypothetical protein